MADYCAKSWRKWCYVEFSQVSNTLNCILTLHRHGELDFKRVKVCVKNNTISVRKDGANYSFHLDGIELLPLTCRGLKYHRIGQIHFSIQGKQLYERDDNDSNVLYREKRFSLQNKIIEKIQLYGSKWFCSVCQQQVLNDSSCFRRVLPLPSENWSEYADMWFCHRHEDKDSSCARSDVRQNGKLLPKQEDCLVGDTYVLISESQTDREAVRAGSNGTLTCSRCGQQIGVIIENKDGVSNGSQVYKLYLYSVVTYALEADKSPHLRYANRKRTEAFFSVLLEEQSMMYTSFRFILEASVTTTVNNTVITTTSYCLIWLLDTNASVYTSGGCQVKDGDSLIEGSSLIGSDSVKDRDKDDVKTTKLVKKQVMKLLFKCQLSGTNLKRPTDFPTKSVISMWKKDNTVHSITLPHPVFLQLVDQLICNSRVLPTSQRLLNGFHVSFLRQTDCESSGT